jgi:hypothetical protein
LEWVEWRGLQIVALVIPQLMLAKNPIIVVGLMESAIGIPASNFITKYKVTNYTFNEL